MRTLRTVLPLLLLVACRTSTVEIPANEYGLHVVSDVDTYREIVARDASHALVDVQQFIPTAIIDVRYASEDNFMKQRLYPEARVLLRRPAAEALAAVQRELSSRGIGIKLFDAYRPYAVTRMMWDEIGDPDYVADPARGSRHNRGAAVDLTLVDLATGRELPMPTGYDSFEPAAHHGYGELPADAIRNRELLREVMIRHGFEPLPTEWWHYDFRGWERFDLLDVPFSAIPR